ncbi:hypothetical protein, partial [Microcoleus anatoxicus]
GKPYNFCCICRLCCINFVWLVGAIAFLAVLPVFAINLAAASRWCYNQAIAILKTEKIGKYDLRKRIMDLAPD